MFLLIKTVLLPCHVPDFRGKAFRYSPVSMMFTVGFFVDALYQVEKVPFYPMFSGRFYNEWMLDFLKIKEIVFYFWLH